MGRASSAEVALARSARGRLSRLVAIPRSARLGLAAARYRGLKRVLDVCVAAALLVVLLPLFAVLVVAIRLESPGPALFRCRRVGLGGVPFDMLKFRKMAHGAAGPPLRSADDERYTRLGRFLAASRLDELPQLCNVLRGDMSLVGPRPEDPSFFRRNERLFAEALSVRPGITGLSQLAFAHEADVLDPDDRMGHYERRILPQKLSLDSLYVVQRNLRIDIKILLWTLAAFFVEIAVHRGTGALNRRRRGDGSVPAALHVVPQREQALPLAGISVVVLAGGTPPGARRAGSLLPDPLMPLGDRSVLETTMNRLDSLGVERVNVCLGEAAKLIRAVFRYQPSAAELTFIDDTQPVGTAGPLRLVSGLDDTFLVINGDVVTTLDYAAMLTAHREAGSVLTIGAYERQTRFDYGLLQVDENDRLRDYREKPDITSSVSMGVYAIEPRALAFIPRRGPFGMPELIQALIRAGLPVGIFRHEGLWFDVSHPDEYQEALSAWADGEL